MDDDARRARTHDVLDRALAALFAHDMAAFAALWAPDGTMEFPFAPPGAPTRLDGRSAVADYVDGYNDAVLPERLVEQVRHDTLDPATTVLEFTVEGRVVVTGSSYRMSYIAVITVASEGITSYRDYWNPQAVADVFGGAPSSAGSSW